MGDSLDESFFRWVETSFPKAQPTLRAPAPADFESRIQAKTGHPLPARLRSLWKTHDGQEGKMHTEIFRNRFSWLSVEAALEEFESMQRVTAEVAREYQSTERWDDTWLPFAVDGCGGLLVVDLANAVVFEFRSEEGERAEDWAPSFDAFIESYLAMFANGTLRVEGEQGVVDTSPPQLKRTDPSHAPPLSAKHWMKLALFFAGLLVMTYLIVSRG